MTHAAAIFSSPVRKLANHSSSSRYSLKTPPTSSVAKRSGKLVLVVLIVSGFLYRLATTLVIRQGCCQSGTVCKSFYLIREAPLVSGVSEPNATGCGHCRVAVTHALRAVDRIATDKWNDSGQTNLQLSDSK